jgi:hypothetical protein
LETNHPALLPHTSAGAIFDKKQCKKLQDHCRGMGGQGVLVLHVGDDGEWSGVQAKHMGLDERTAVRTFQPSTLRVQRFPGTFHFRMENLEPYTRAHLCAFCYTASRLNGEH